MWHFKMHVANLAQSSDDKKTQSDDTDRPVVVEMAQLIGQSLHVVRRARVKCGRADLFGR